MRENNPGYLGYFITVLLFTLLLLIPSVLSVDFSFAQTEGFPQRV